MDAVQRRVAELAARFRQSVPWLPLSYIVHVGNGCAVVAMCSEDMLKLRSFMVCASSFAIAYNLLQPLPLIAPAAWGSFFVCGHLFQISKILRDRVEIEMTNDQADLYEFAFHPHGFRPRHFVKLMAAGRTEWCAAGEDIVTAGEDAAEIILICSGCADVNDSAGEVKGQLRKNRFIGNMVKGRGAHEWNHNVRAREPCKLVRWRRSELQQIINSDKELIECAARLTATDLSRKLSDVEHCHLLKEYKCMLAVAVADGRLVPEEKSQLFEFRQRYGFSQVDHLACLESVGWLKEEYENGVKKDKLWPHNLKRLRPFLDHEEGGAGAAAAAAAAPGAKERLPRTPASDSGDP